MPAFVNQRGVTLQAQFTDHAGTPIPIPGYSAVVTVVTGGTRTRTADLEASVTNGRKGIVEYTLVAADLTDDEIGQWQFQFIATSPDGLIEYVHLPESFELTARL